MEFGVDQEPILIDSQTKWLNKLMYKSMCSTKNAANRIGTWKWIIPSLFIFFSSILPLFGQTGEAHLDSGDTAWMITATALVLFMTVPGLVLCRPGFQ